MKKQNKTTSPGNIVEYVCIHGQTSEIAELVISYWNFSCMSQGLDSDGLHFWQDSWKDTISHTLCFKIHVSLCSHFLLSWSKTCGVCWGSATPGLRFRTEFHSSMESVWLYAWGPVIQRLLSPRLVFEGCWGKRIKIPLWYRRGWQMGFSCTSWQKP